MIWWLLAAHVAGLVAVTTGWRALGHRVFLVAAIAPAATTAWVIPRLGTGDPEVAEVTWVAGLDLVIRFRVDALSAMMTLLVSGIGVLVFAYASGYFSRGAPALGRFTGNLLAFSLAMLGLVWSDTVWTLFVFWELTSITSFLLVGHKDADPIARAAARRALILTVGGGLALLGAFVVLVDTTGDGGLSDLQPATGTAAGVAAVLVLLAAATKSAQVPFHVWLPGAMAAPTPVSAYLHSATMVKAGVFLVALAAPALGGTAVWTPLGVTIGLSSMVWGAVGALRHHDAKLILAWGTISQLGLMIALLSLGESKATFAGLSILFAHALFKAALFMVVGEIDVRTGTRDIRRTSGLARSMPVAMVVAVGAGLSMAGAPPLLGFPAKEAAIEAVLGRSGPGGFAVAAIVVGASALTVAYTVRLLIGLFHTRSDADVTAVAPPRAGLAVPAAVLSFAGLAGYVAIGVVNDIVRPAAVDVDPGAEAYSLLRWPGLGTALVVSVAVLVVGGALGVVAARRIGSAPAPVGAELVDRVLDGVIRISHRVAGAVQHGSLPVYLVTMAGCATAAVLPFVADVDLGEVRLGDNAPQVVLSALVVGAAVAAAQVTSRLGAALGLGAVGIAVSGLFLAQGAPDLALTQLLVETVIVVGFVIGLGRLGRRFPDTGRVWRRVRVGASVLAGLAVVAALVASGARPTGEPPLDRLTDGAVDDGGGNNLVNVILTDVRALDTVGEVAVLVVVAVGVLALAGRRGRPPRTADRSTDPTSPREREEAAR